jgi:hypothetical protein
MAAPRTADYALLCRVIDQLILAASARDVERTLASVARLVPEYHPAVHGNGGRAEPIPMPHVGVERHEPEIAAASFPKAG